MKDGLTLDYLETIPKTDLHLHLDGSLRISTLVELAKQENIELPSQTEEGLKELVFKDTYKDLPDYLSGFAYTVSVMQNPENLERIAYELAWDNLNENVRYIEVRYAPQLHIHEKLSMQEVIEAVAKGLERAKKEFNATEAVKNGTDLPFHYGIIICALRWFNKYMSEYYRKLYSVMSYAPHHRVFAAASLELAQAGVKLRREHGLPIVALDLAGAEAGNPADDHRHAFTHAHDNFLAKTVHAGEAYGPESIFQAITDCHATRIGHGTHLFEANMVKSDRIENKQRYVDELVEYIARQRIPIEINLTSNLQTLPDMKSVAEHPLKKMIKAHIAANICTDNRLVSNTTVTNELHLAARELNLSRKEVRNLVIAGFKGAFFPDGYAAKRAYVRKAINSLNKIDADCDAANA